MCRQARMPGRAPRCRHVRDEDHGSRAAVRREPRGIRFQARGVLMLEVLHEGDATSDGAASAGTCKAIPKPNPWRQRWGGGGWPAHLDAARVGRTRILKHALRRAVSTHHRHLARDVKVCQHLHSTLQCDACPCPAGARVSETRVGGTQPDSEACSASVGHQAPLSAPPVRYFHVEPHECIA